MLDAFLALIQGQRPQRIVWPADISYWIAGRRAAGNHNHAWDTEQGYLQLHRDLKVMPYYSYDKFWAASPRYSADITLWQETEGRRTLNRIGTPVGTLTEATTYLAGSCSTACTKHYIESEDDLDILLYILEHRELMAANLEDYSERMALWRRYDGLPCLALPRSPLPAFIYEWAGIETATYLLADCKQEVAEALRLMAEQEEPIIEALCELRPPLVHFPDNLSSDNLTSYYDTFMRQGHSQRLGTLHAAGIKAAVHLDGTIRGLLPKLVDVGFDAIEALTPLPAGDLSLDEIQRLAGSDAVILWGGVPGAMFAAPYTWSDVEDHVQRLLDCWGNRPFVLGVADQVPPDGDISFCPRIAEMLALGPPVAPDMATLSFRKSSSRS